MERIVTHFWRYFARRDNPATEIHVNRIARGGAQDRVLAAFKADQARIAEKREAARRVARPDGGHFSTQRAAK